jgi:hypothetical protein
MWNYQSGAFVPVAWQPTGGNLATLDIKEHTLDLSVLLVDVTSVSHQAVRARIAGPLDIAGTCQLALDLDAPPWANPPLVIPGLRGIAGFGINPTKQMQVPVSIEKLHLASAIEKEVQWSVDMKGNRIAGLVVYPPL